MAGSLPNPNAREGQAWLVVAATPREANAVLDALADRRPNPSGDRWPPAIVERGPIHVVVSGVGKASAAAATAHALDPRRHLGVVSIGLAGALPGSGLAIGDIVIADRMVLADEGSENPGGFVDLGAMGFGPMADGSVSAPSDARAIAALAEALPGSRTGCIATVSTCSGTDARAAAIASRTGAIAEAMEGAAIAQAARMVGGPGFPVVEVRAISNTTGDRPGQRWDLAAGFAALSRIASVL